MKTLPLLTALLSLGACSTTGPAATSAADGQPLDWPATIDDLRWLVGEWITCPAIPDAGCFVQHWLPPADGTMMGVGRIERGGDTYPQETWRIFADEGRLVLVTMHESGPAKRYPLTQVVHGGFHAVGSGPADKALSVSYRRGPHDTLEATVSGPTGPAVPLKFKRKGSPAPR